MKKLFRIPLFRRAPFLSPGDLLQRAVLFGVIFLIAHLAGLREFTSVLNGTTGSTAYSWQTSAFLGLLYVGLYLGGVLVAPILVLAAGLLKLGEAMNRKKHESRT
jgi:hypothetical protein